MKLEEISIEEFEMLASTSNIRNYYESINYALILSEQGYEYEFIKYSGMEVLAVALILYRKVGSWYYGYSPRGFLVDYSNYFILDDFTNALKDYYKKKHFAFIKINPEIAVSKLNNKTLNYEYNENYHILDNLIKCGYKKTNTETLPKINAILNLSTFNINNINKNTRNKIKKGIRKGLYLEKIDNTKLNTFYKFIKNKTSKDIYYYNDYYNVFSKDNMIDMFLVKINYRDCLINAQESYQRELSNNNLLNNKIINENNTNIINKKMQSDIALLSYKNDIAEASRYLNSGIDTYVACAMVIKYENRVIIKSSGFDKEYQRYSPNYFLYYALVEYYKTDYKYMDMFGLVGSLSHDNPYYGLNRFKLGFNPDVYEYIGEFDLVINEKGYNILNKGNILNKEYDKLKEN